MKKLKSLRKARFVALPLLFAAMLLFSSCVAVLPEEDPNLPPESDTAPSPEPEERGVTELGNPIGEYFKGNPNAKSVWEVFVFDGKAYLGCGDGNGNSSPTPIFSYDLEAEDFIPTQDRFELVGEITEEYVVRFAEMDGRLIVLGADPAFDVYTWNEGTYYTLLEKGFDVTVFDSGPHTYDFVFFEGRHFIAKQTLFDGEPVIVSDDGGATWQDVLLFKDGVQQVWEPESYIVGEKFLTLNGTLYLYFYNSGKELGYHHFLYEYKDGAFHQMSLSWPDELRLSSVVPNLQGGLLHSTAEFSGKAYVAAGHLMVTEDMQTIRKITLPAPCRVQEILVRDDSLFVMASTTKGIGEYETLVYQTRDGKTFEEAARFTYPLPCYSFDYYNGTFYFGTGSAGTVGDSSIDNEKLGTLLSFENLSKK